MKANYLVGLFALLAMAMCIVPASAYTTQSAYGSIDGAQYSQQHVLAVNDGGDYVQQQTEAYLGTGYNPYYYYNTGSQNVYQSVQTINVKGRYVDQSAYGEVSQSAYSEQYVSVENMKKNYASQYGDADMYRALNVYQSVTVLNQ